MKTLDEIKKLMAMCDTVQADEALKELLAAEPNNLQAKMLYGTCRQLLGDEETFRRIHDELAPVMVKLSDFPIPEAAESKAETLSLWKKYQTMWECLILGTLVLGGAVAGITYFGKKIQQEMQATQEALAVYAGPRYQLYAGPHYYETKSRDPSYYEREDAQKFFTAEEGTSK